MHQHFLPRINFAWLTVANSLCYAVLHWLFSVSDGDCLHLLDLERIFWGWFAHLCAEHCHTTTFISLSFAEALGKHTGAFRGLASAPFLGTCPSQHHPGMTTVNTWGVYMPAFPQFPNQTCCMPILILFLYWLQMKILTLFPIFKHAVTDMWVEPINGPRLF